MYRMPTLPILQMSGRGNVYYWGEPQSPPMTSMRTLRIPPEFLFPSVSPSKHAFIHPQSIDFTDFHPIQS